MNLVVGGVPKKHIASACAIAQCNKDAWLLHWGSTPYEHDIY